MLSAEEKKAIVTKFGADENDTGSPEVQIAPYEPYPLSDGTSPQPQKGSCIPPRLIETRRSAP